MNCLTYAIGKWWVDGGMVRVRRSHLGREFGITSNWHPASWVPHFMHVSEGGVITQYTASPWQKHYDQRRGLFKTWIRLWSFDGVVIVGDDERV